MTPKTVSVKRAVVGRALFAAGNRSGSVMVGALAAMTFVGIVISFMVRSTGAQARVSTSFAAVMNANLAVSNGIMATESFFSRTENEEEALAMLNASKDGLVDFAPVWGAWDDGTVKRRRLGGSDQYFSCKLTGVNIVGDNIYARFDVDGGNRERGRALRSATALYRVDHVTIAPDDGSGNWGMSALYFGNSRLNTSNIVRLKVEGYATFAKAGDPKDRSSYYEIKPSGNTNTVEFLPDDLGRGDVFFNGPANLRNNVLFGTNVFFNSYAELDMFTGGGTVFGKDVGFRENFAVNTGGADLSVKFDGNVWMNGGLRFYDRGGGVDAQFDDNLTLRGDVGGAFNYTLNARFFIPGDCSESGVCALHGLLPSEHMHPAPGSAGVPGGWDGVKKGGPAGFGNTPASAPITGIPPASMSEQYIRDRLLSPNSAGDMMPMKSLEDRMEPNLALDMPDKEFYNLSDMKSYNITGEDLTNYIKDMRRKAENDADLRKYFFPDHRNGHFLVNVTPGNWNYDPGTFNEKIVFNYTAHNYDFGRNFYNSGPDASTMIYVGPNAGFPQFEMPNNGVFRGLIYVHHQNNLNHAFQPSGTTNTFEGALLFNGGREIDIRSGSVNVRRSDAAVAPFGCMLKRINADGTSGDYVGGACGGGGGDIVKSPDFPEVSGIPAPNVNLRMIGVYYR